MGLPVPERPRLVAVVVTFNGEQWIRECLGSLERSTLCPSVVVVDNGSSDGTLAIVAKEFPKVQVRPQRRNLGFGAANNIGLREALRAEADYVLLLNQDAWVAPDALERLAVVGERHARVGILSPLHLNYDGTAFDVHFPLYMQKTPELWFDLYRGRLGDHYIVSFLPAALWLLKRRTVEDVGGFDPIFFLYGEDEDWVARARVWGWEMALVPHAIGYHYRTRHEGTGDQRRRLERRYYAELVAAAKRSGCSLCGCLARGFRQCLLDATRHLAMRDHMRLKCTVRAGLLFFSRAPQVHKALRGAGEKAQFL